MIAELIQRNREARHEDDSSGESSSREPAPLNPNAASNARVILNALLLNFGSTRFTTQEARECLRASALASESMNVLCPNPATRWASGVQHVLLQLRDRDLLGSSALRVRLLGNGKLHWFFA